MDANALLAEKRDVISRTARAFVHRTGWIEYDDAVQIVSLAAWRVLENPSVCDVDTAIASAGYQRLVDELRSGRVTGVTRAGRRNGVTAPTSLNAAASLNAGERELVDTLEDKFDEYARVDDEDFVASAIARLPERERFVVYLYYYERLTLREIGEILGVTESRVCQISEVALGRMRRVLAAAA